MTVVLNHDQITEIFEKYKKSGDIQDYGRDLDGQLGKIKEVKYRDRINVGKIIMKDISEDERKIKEIRGNNIIRINKICKAQKDYGVTYHLIIMEKAKIRDMDKLINYYHKYNLLKLIFKFPFDDSMDDNLLRFFVKQIIEGLEIYDRNNYFCNIKHENILISLNLILKLSNLNYLDKIKDKNDKKAEYFTLGKAIFFIKFGKKLFKDNILLELDQKEKNIDVLLKRISKVNKYKIMNRDLIYLLIKLIKGDITFEQIYRNNWLNKNLDYIEKVVSNFERDEEKIIMELSKQDFIIKKNKIIEYNTKIINKNLLVNNNGKERKKSNLCLLGKKFRFKK